MKSSVPKAAGKAVEIRVLVKIGQFELLDEIAVVGRGFPGIRLPFEVLQTPAQLSQLARGNRMARAGWTTLTQDLPSRFGELEQAGSFAFRPGLHQGWQKIAQHRPDNELGFAIPVESSTLIRF
jgi:hypothetical protein